MRLKWKLAFGLALLNDFLDLTGIGSIPIVGDILDALTSAALWKVIGGKYTTATLLEFIPGFDILPIYTATVSYAYLQKEKRQDKGKRKVKVQ
jgi:hypothetical protein